MSPPNYSCVCVHACVCVCVCACACVCVCEWLSVVMALCVQEEMEKRLELETTTGSQFSVSQRETKMTEALLETTKDIKIERFSISARGKDLLVNASLQITAGRRYGLVGPNG